MVKFRPYDTSLNQQPIEFLYDADEYYQDILESVKGLSEPKIFLTGWVIVPDTPLSVNKRLRDLIVDLLKLPNSCCYILWNSNIAGPNPGIVDRIENFRNWVGQAIKDGDIDQKLKIIISVNRGFDPGWKLSMLNEASRSAFWGKENNTVPPSVLDKVQEFWEKQFAEKPKSKREYRNLRVFSGGSHHQKTIVIAGKKENKQVLIGYCGIDFAPNVAGPNGGRDWHDAGMRVHSDMARGLLNNFTQRWNFEVEKLNEIVHFGVSATDVLDPDSIFPEEDHPLADEIEARRTIPVRVDLHRDWTVTAAQWALREWNKQILDDYLEYIDDAEEWIYIENQYFRHLEIAEALEEALEDESNLRVTIVIPAYSEEIGFREDLPSLRRSYSSTTDAARKSKILDEIKKQASTINIYNKVSLLFQSKCLTNLVPHPRVRVWIPQIVKGNRVVGRPYIHTKLLIVDDKCLHVGSANVNGRSLDGYADSEINLRLIQKETINRIKGRIKWQNEPDSEQDPHYSRWSNTDPSPTYYARYNLVRYTTSHLEVDKELGSFPVGKQKILDYWETFNQNKSKRVETWTPNKSRQEVEKYLDTLDTVPGIDIETFDWNTFFLETFGHLV